MKDAHHGREIYTGRDIAQILRRWFAFIGRRVSAQVTHGHRVNLSSYVEPMARSLFPLIENYFAQGAARARRDILIQLVKRRVAKQAHGIQVKRGETVPAFLIGFDILAPQVQTALLNRTFEFVQETLNTAAVDAENAYAEVLRQLSAGLEQGDTQREISKRIVGIFNDPVRAFRISTFESSFAIHGGEIAQAKASQLKTKKRWLASADCCDLCQKLEDVGAIDLDQPYLIIPSRNPKYASIYHPAAHPHCACSQLIEVQ